jgi:hypothetical protein
MALPECRAGGRATLLNHNPAPSDRRPRADCIAQVADGRAPRSRAFPSTDLDQIHSGTMYLSVPLVDDVIHVGLGGDYLTGTIRVSKSPTVVTVRRVDGKPMQAQILRDRPEYAGPDTGTAVFREPVDCLTLERTGRGLWFARCDGHVDRHQDLQQLVNTIATFGLAKQRKMSTTRT